MYFHSVMGLNFLNSFCHFNSLINHWNTYLQLGHLISISPTFSLLGLILALQFGQNINLPIEDQFLFFSDISKSTKKTTIICVSLFLLTSAPVDRVQVRLRIVFWFALLGMGNHIRKPYPIRSQWSVLHFCVLFLIRNELR